MASTQDPVRRLRVAGEDIEFADQGNGEPILLVHGGGVQRLVLARAADTLSGYLREHDADQWVDPNTVAGAVADVLDTARVVLALTDVEPTVG